MPGPPTLQGPFRVPSFNPYIPRLAQPWIYLLIAFMFQMAGGIYGGAMSYVMGDYSLMREDVLMIIMCNVVGVNMPFPFLFRLKFRFTNRQLLITSALVVGVCNVLILQTQSMVVMCVLAYVSGFFKLCGTFECMSNIQLWMTPKRDFTVFFPLLYCIVLGNMSLSPWITEHLIYICQSWQVMNWLMAGIMFCIALFLVLTTHNFMFMKPLPFVSLDWLGCALWSAAMIEFIWFFNYGEFYNWLLAPEMQACAVMFFITMWICIGRMLHVRHPYIDPAAWKYKNLVPMLIVFAFVEFMSSTPKVLQTAFTGGVLHFGITTLNVLNLVEWVAAISGCLFCLVWTKVFKMKYTRLMPLGVAAMAAYQVMMYMLVAPGVNIELLYLPVFLRNFGNAIFFVMLTIYIEDMMPFQHFFMGLTMCGLVRNGTIGTMCSGLFSLAMRHGVAENLGRGLPYDMTGILSITIRQLYGVASMIGIAVLLVFLLWNVQPIRSTLNKMPAWNVVGRRMRMTLRHK